MKAGAVGLRAARPGLTNLVPRTGRVLRSVLAPWIVARVIVLGTLAVAHFVVDRIHPGTPGVTARVHQGLLGWDAGWYEAIARFGYAPLGHQSLRFFPLFSLAGRALGFVTGLGDGDALVMLANASALVATALVFVLVRRESGDEVLARRAVWLLSIVPPAFVLVMGYAEATLLVFSVGCFLAIRRGAGRGHWTGRPGPAWCSAAALGFAAGLTRPLGVLLVVPVVVEAVRRRRSMTGREQAAAALAAFAPLAGMAVFLGWSARVFGDALLPLRVQAQAGHHGGLSDPVATLVHDARGLVHHHVGTALHLPWVLVVVALLVVCWRRWPASYGAFATAVVLVALSGTNLDSFERYSLSAFPLVLAGASLISRPTVERSVLVLAGAGLAVYALLAFCNLLVP